MSDTHTIPNFDRRFLAAIKGQVNLDTLNVMQAWRTAEGLYPESTARWNPLHSTLYVDGFTESTDYNSTAHVRNYKYEFAGLAAIILTICTHESDGTMRYGGIVADLQKGDKTANQIVSDRRSQFEKWGTDVDLLLQVIDDIQAGR